MPSFDYRVRVIAPTKQQADQVMAERIDPYEDYGFPYGVGVIDSSPWPAPTPRTKGDWDAYRRWAQVWTSPTHVVKAPCDLMGDIIDPTGWVK